MVGSMSSPCAALPVFTLMILLCGEPAAAAKKWCTASSEIGAFVQLGSSFRMYCTSEYPCPGKKSIHINLEEVNSHIHNDTTSSVTVTNIRENKTFTCKCTTSSKDSGICGYDIYPGYPPQAPENLTCIQKGESGSITCSWKKGRETHLWPTSQLWVKTVAPNGTAVVISKLGSGSVTFPVFKSQTFYSVWVTETNKLGSAVSESLNFSLNDIVKPLPPDINGVNCSSRHCILHWDSGQNPLRMQVQYRTDQGSWTTPLFIANANQTWVMQDLEPLTMYEMRARCKLMPGRGLWSEWSTVQSRTDEEVPLKKLDIWYTEESPQSQNTDLTVLWKEPSKSEAGGRILGYSLEVHDLKQGGTTLYNTNSSAGCSIACTRCNVTLFTYNSKGHSPPVHITLPLQTDQSEVAPLKVRCMPHSNSSNSIAISWQKPATARPVREYLVEWHPARNRKQGLRWKRINHDQLHTVITKDIRPGDCYKGAVYALYDNIIAGKASFLDAFSLESAPTQGPSPSVTVGDGRVTVTWTEIPLEQRGGCLKRYTIYLERAMDRTVRKYGPIDPSLTSYSALSGLHPGEKYNLSMTGSTTAGEGHRGRTCIFFFPRQEDQQVLSVIMFASCTFFLCLLLVISLWQISSVQQRVSKCCFCIMPDIPDPANSKWAKECAAIKGQLMLEYQLSLDDSIESEEEPHTMEVQEFSMPWDLVNPELSSTSPPVGGTTDLCLLLQPNHSPLQAPPLYEGQLTFSYIKSLSHESSSSEQTQETKSTDVTVDYISPQGLLADGSEVEAEEDCLGDLNFFPYRPSPFLEPMFPCGGKLTLDAVKIDCSFLE
ncbi:interleukin-12 receptor subunit beta-2 isoform X2 [Conger conger]|uniref:interleukin-12 receptor subunit beta-2 isoform X2 n=1 Tax=Conger conger TaxID=82655 RepID=UPI002A5AEF04|nr:interleukin-12 receptor subunit beta-2 isoform X2 [Conger conger]